MTPPVAMTIAGTDSAGGAGLAADLRTFAAHRVHGTFAVTVVTAQSTVEVRRALPMPVDLVVDQIDAVVDDLDIGAVKTGLLLTADLVDAIADLVESGRLPAPVVDPVLVDRRGQPLGDPARHAGLVEAYIGRLMPLAALSTPNIDEAALLAESGVSTAEEMDLAAAAIAERCGTPVLVTGGRLAGPAELIDVFADRAGVRRISSPKVDTANNHGTGDSLAAAVAAELAHGADLGSAVDRAIVATAAATRRAVSWELGSGHGPIDHLGWGDPPAAL